MLKVTARVQERGGAEINHRHTHHLAVFVISRQFDGCKRRSRCSRAFSEPRDRQLLRGVREQETQAAGKALKASGARPSLNRKSIKHVLLRRANGQPR